MKSIYYFAIIISFLLLACKPQKVEEVQFDFLASAAETTDMTDVSQVVDMSRDSIINPHGILSFGDYIILVDSRTSRALTIYNEQTKVYEHFLARGNANNEIKFASNIGLMSAAEQTFYVRDLSYGRLFFLKIERATGEIKFRYTTNLNKLGKVSDFGFDGNTIVAGLTSSLHQYVVAASPREVAARFGDFLAFDFDRDSASLGEVSYEGRVALDRENNRMAFLSTAGETLEIIKYADDHLTEQQKKQLKQKQQKQREQVAKKLAKNGAKKDSVKLGLVADAANVADADSVEVVEIRDSIVLSKIFRMPKFKTTERQGRFSTAVNPNSSRVGFLSVTASKNCIYGLYDGRTRAQANGKNNNQDGLIYNLCIFDWEGNFVMHVTSEYGMKAISFNDQQRKLYCLCMTETGEYEVCAISEDDLFRMQ